MKYLTSVAVLLMTAATGVAQHTSSSPSPAPAQRVVVPVPQAYGKIDKADMELKKCDFEPDANAMVLFNKADLYYDFDNRNGFTTVIQHHKRIKIFNDAGKKQADVRIEYFGGRFEYITGLQAEIFNLNGDKIETVKLDKKQIFTEAVDKNTMAQVFSFPNVKPGSVIEYKYTETINDVSYIPDFFFQEDIPVRYSELFTRIPDWFYFTVQQRTYQPYYKLENTKANKSIGSGDDVMTLNENCQLRAMANVRSIPSEPYMSSVADNVQGLYFHLTTFRPPAGFVQSLSDTWAKVGGILADDEDFGLQLKKKLTNEEAIIAKAKAMKSDDDRIAYIFNEVKNTIKWNGIDRWYTNDGTAKAWTAKTGNSSELNLILYHLLKQSGVRAYPMVVSTRNHGRVNPSYTFLYQFNRAVVYVPVDSTKRYILDATSKYNTYNETPDNLLNSHGLYIDKDNKKYDLVYLNRDEPVRQVTFVNADIEASGKMKGTAQISSFSYNRINSVENFKTNGEKKYIDFLRDNNNSLTISSLKFDNMEVDTLPLVQNINFNLELTGSDGNYIYFNPNIFTSLRTNPFLSENRECDIDFSHRNAYTVSGVYKMPAGFKTEALPTSVSIVMPDKSIGFRRIVAEQGGTIVVRYSIDFKKAQYFKEDYQDLRAFYKKMHEMLNEQIVLKKS